MRRRYRVMVLSLLGTVCGCERPHPRDADLLATFVRNRPAFERILVMARADRDLPRVAAEFLRRADGRIWYRDSEGPPISQGHWNEYRRLFREVGVHEGFSRLTDSAEPLLLMCSVQGILDSGTAKGYAYSSRPLTPIVTSLDDPERIWANAPASDDDAFVPIASGWYLFYSRD